jgi:hypothetical protein
MKNLIKFNIWKHHLNKIKDIKRFQQYDLRNQKRMREFVEILKSIGTNNIDLYIGEASVDELFNYFENILKRAGADDSIVKYSTWIGKKNYKKISFYDGSEWVFRLGNEPDKFIHIHPGRNCSYVVRINANWWKTAVLIYFLDLNEAFQSISSKSDRLEFINNYRKKILELSPVKLLKPENDLEKGLRLLHSL